MPLPKDLDFAEQEMLYELQRRMAARKRGQDTGKFPEMNETAWAEAGRSRTSREKVKMNDARRRALVEAKVHELGGDLSAADELLMLGDIPQDPRYVATPSSTSLEGYYLKGPSLEELEVRQPEGLRLSMGRPQIKPELELVMGAPEDLKYHELALGKPEMSEPTAAQLLAARLESRRRR